MSKSTKTTTKLLQRILINVAKAALAVKVKQARKVRAGAPSPTGGYAKLVPI